MPGFVHPIGRCFMTRYIHTNLIANDWKRLSAFYQKVFGCYPVPPERDLSGEWLEKLTGQTGVRIRGEHLCVPGYANELPTLEIFSYETIQNTEKALNSAGFSHIAFEVDSVPETLAVILREGGSAVGDVVSREYSGRGVATFVYARDIEGNIIELQSWQRFS